MHYGDIIAYDDTLLDGKSFLLSIEQFYWLN